jgi:hypothetical protein
MISFSRQPGVFTAVKPPGGFKNSGISIFAGRIINDVIYTPFNWYMTKSGGYFIASII